MKLWINSLLRKSISKLPIRLTKLLVRPSVKSWSLMVQDFKRILYPLNGSLTVNRVRLIKQFHINLSNLYRTQGPKGTVLFLKVLTVLLQQVPNGYIVPDTSGIGCRISRTKQGLPRILPAGQRKLIRQGDVNTVRFYLTLSNYYRCIHFPGKLKLNSITDPSKALPNLPSVSSAVSYFKDLFFDDAGNWQIGKLQVFQTSGPQSYSKGNSSYGSITRSAELLERDPVLSSSLKNLLDLTNNLFVSTIYKEALTLSKFSDYTSNYYHEFLGKLSIKDEPAGKRRVFAMVDPFTQWALQPLHDYLFSVLRRHSIIDGTFDQTGPLKRVPFKSGVPIYSFDLSSATDRLPITLQVDILASVFGKSFAESWRDLLVHREYMLPEGKTSGIRYAVGQPMGALSSWDMLAITHHYIIQYSAWSSGVTPFGKLFTSYVVLGDDMVIWNATVAKRYLSTLKILGVECGLHKSIISLNGSGLEFAKQTYVQGLNASPITIKDIEASHRTMGEFVSFAKRHSMSLVAQLRYLGYGYKVLPNSNHRVVKLLNLYNMIPNEFSDVSKLLSFFDRPYMSLIDAVLPRADARRALFLLVHSELLSLKDKVSFQLDSLMEKSVAYSVSSIGPDRTQEAAIAVELLVPSMNLYIQELYNLRQEFYYYIPSLSDLYSFYTGFEWEIPHGPDNLSGHNDFRASVQLIFKTQALLDQLQQTHFDLDHHPESRKPIYYRESNSRVRLMMKWMGVLKQFRS